MREALRASRPAGGSSAAGVPPNKTSTIYTKIYTWNLKLYGTSSEYCIDSFHTQLHWFVMYTWSQGRSTKAKSVDRALSCNLGVTQRDVRLPNMYPESYDCGLPGHLAVIRWRPSQKRRAAGHNRQHVISRRLRVLPTCPEWLWLSPGLPSPAEAGLWQLTQGSRYGSHHARSLETSWWIGNKNCQIPRRTHSKLCYM